MMRRRIWMVLLAAIAAAAGSVIFMNCMDNVAPSEPELDRYPQFQPFVADRIGFKGIVHNLDTGLYVFEITTPYDSAAAYFASVHARAAQRGWELATSSSLERVYQRPYQYIGRVAHEQVRLSFHPKSSTVRFERRSVY